MAILTIDLPDDLAAKIEAKGLLSPNALEAYVKGHLQEMEAREEYPPGFDHRLKGAVNPAAYRRGRILGDIISPIGAELESME